MNEETIKNYDEFVEQVQESLKIALKAYGIQEICVIQDTGLNQIKNDVLMIIDKERRMTFNMIEYYLDFCRGIPLADVVHNISKRYEISLKNIVLMEADKTDMIQEQLIPWLISEEKNRQLLKTCPHRIFAEGLAVTYWIKIGSDENCLTTVMVDHNMFQPWNSLSWHRTTKGGPPYYLRWTGACG